MHNIKKMNINEKDIKIALNSSTLSTSISSKIKVLKPFGKS